MSPLSRLADLWIDRHVTLDDEVISARAAVAHLKPIVLVTGGTRGIGAAIARRFAEAGNEVAIVARGQPALDGLAAEISARTGRRVLVIPTDLSNRDAHKSIDITLAEAGCYVEVLVNNAAMGLSGPFAAHTLEQVENLLALNVAATSRLMHHYLKPMRARQKGGILNVASLGGAVPGPNQAAYYASKAFVLSLTEAVASELSGYGIRIAVLAPGPVDTGFHRDMGAEGSLYRLLIPALSPERTARIAYRGFMMGQRLIIPGLLNRLMYAAVRVLPHFLTAPLMLHLLAPPKE